MKKQKEAENLTIHLQLSDEDWDELNNRWDYQEWHWKMYSYMSSNIINGVSIIELKMNDFICDYFSFCDKNRSTQLNEYLISSMSLRNKFNLFKKLLTHIDIEELSEIKGTDYNRINEFDKVINYRNVFAHSVVDQNYKNPKELKERQKIKLQYLSAKNQKQNIRYVNITDHRKIISLLTEIDHMMRDIVLDINHGKFDSLFFTHNKPNVSQYEPQGN